MMMLTNDKELPGLVLKIYRSVFRQCLPVALVILAMCLPQFGGATHLIGGDLRYRCLGNNDYEIRLTYRRDCLLGAPGTEFEPLASIGFFNAQNNAPVLTVGINGLILIPFNPSDTINQYLISDCTIAGQDVCVHETVYVDTVHLPLYQPGYKIVYQRCCRNSSLMNVFDPTNTGMTLVAELSFEAQQVCNNSPVLGDYPPIYICVDRDIEFDFVATDPDGDSLVYELFTPFLGASDLFPRPSPPPQPPYTEITWNTPPYSLDDLLGGIPLEIDRFTGHMSGTPNTIGQFLVGVKVFSYRNGVLIETTTREWQYNVRACRDVPAADFTVSADLNCDNLSIEFSEQAIYADQYLWVFDYGNPNSQTSAELNPTFDFPGPGFYDVALIVNDFDSICFDTAIVTVGVFESELSADFTIAVPECDQSIVLNVLDSSTDPDTLYDIVGWQYVLSDSTSCDTVDQQNPAFMFDTSMAGLNLSLTVTSANGCTATVDTTFDVNILRIEFKGDTVGVCNGDSVALFNVPGGPFTYTWSPTTDLDTMTDPLNPVAYPTETTTYYLTITDGLCEVSDSVVVAVQELPELAFTTETDCRSLVLNTMNTSTGGHQFIWYFGDMDSSLENSPTHIYDSAGVYTVTLVSNDGCDAETSMEITVNVIDEPVEDTSTSCFAEAVVLNGDANSAYEYIWSPTEFILSSPDTASPLVQVDTTTTFSVTITDPELPGCSITEEVVVMVPPDFEFPHTPDTTYCEAPAITLNGANGELSYTWCDLAGNVLFEGPDFTTAPDTVTTYVVKGMDANGCVKSDTITLTPTFFSLEVGPDVIICSGDDTSIYVLNLDTTQDLSYLWTPSNLVFPDTVNNPTVNPEVDQIFTVQITNNDVGCVTTETIKVSVSEFDLEYTPDFILCLGDSIFLNVSNGDTTDLTFEWTPVDQIDDGWDTANPLVSPEETTDYTVHVTDNYGCETTLEVTVVVSWFDPGDLIISVDEDTIILGDKVFHIYTNQDPSLDFIWSGDGIIGSSTSPEIEANPPSEGDDYVYCVTVTNEDNCELTGCTQALTVLDPLCNEETVFIPDAFSPNDDGENDELRVYSNYIEQLELHIYNRWGEEVFVSYDQNNVWDGRFKGKELPPDVFGYYLRVICTPDKPYFRKGNITLFR